MNANTLATLKQQLVLIAGTPRAGQKSGALHPETVPLANKKDFGKKIGVPIKSALESVFDKDYLRPKSAYFVGFGMIFSKENT